MTDPDVRAPRVLFVCVENAGRSQMAEAFFRAQGGNADSAGTLPAAMINPMVVTAMAEKGIDISGALPKGLTSEMIERSDLVITMGCSVEEVCPRPMLARMQIKLIDWHLDDPKGKPLDEVRRIRDDIEKKVLDLMNEQTLK